MTSGGTLIANSLDPLLMGVSESTLFLNERRRSQPHGGSCGLPQRGTRSDRHTSWSIRKEGSSLPFSMDRFSSTTLLVPAQTGSTFPEQCVDVA